MKIKRQKKRVCFSDFLWQQVINRNSCFTFFFLKKKKTKESKSQDFEVGESDNLPFFCFFFSFVGFNWNNVHRETFKRCLTEYLNRTLWEFEQCKKMRFHDIDTKNWALCPDDFINNIRPNHEQQLLINCKEVLPTQIVLNESEYYLLKFGRYWEILKKDLFDQKKPSNFGYILAQNHHLPSVAVRRKQERIRSINRKQKHSHETCNEQDVWHLY